MVNSMSILQSLLLKEKNRNENMIKEYSRELENLVKGSIKIKKVNDKIYYYLIFRNGEKVITKYIGKDEESLKAIREQLIRRKQVEEILKQLKYENMTIKKMEDLL